MKRASTLLALILALSAPGYPKHEKMPLPQQVMTAKTVFIDNRSGHADLGDKCYDEIKKWGRFQIVNSADNADVVLLLSSKEYIRGYTSNTSHTTTGNVDDNGNYNANTYGSGSSTAIYGGTTYINLIDPKSGNALWSDAKTWGRWKSATRGLVKELRDRINDQEKGNKIHSSWATDESSSGALDPGQNPGTSGTSNPQPASNISAQPPPRAERKTVSSQPSQSSQPCERGSEAATLGVMVCSADGGLRVISVRAGSPAARAAILPGDIVTSIDGRPVRSSNDIETAIAANTSGTVKVGYMIQGNFLVEHEAKVR